jgi:hypothetical protein
LRAIIFPLLVRLPVIPPFTSDGVLPEGKYECTLPEMDRAFGFSDKRRAILGGFRRALNSIPFFDAVKYVLVDGSFVESKRDPSDIDFVLVVDELREGYPSSNLLHWVAAHHISLKSMYHCDVYVASEGFVASYWDGKFGLSRQNRPKGMVRLSSTRRGAP